MKEELHQDIYSCALHKQNIDFSEIKVLAESTDRPHISSILKTPKNALSIGIDLLDLAETQRQSIQETIKLSIIIKEQEIEEFELTYMAAYCCFFNALMFGEDKATFYLSYLHDNGYGIRQSTTLAIFYATLGYKLDNKYCKILLNEEYNATSGEAIILELTKQFPRPLDFPNILNAEVKDLRPDVNISEFADEILENANLYDMDNTIHDAKIYIQYVHFPIIDPDVMERRSSFFLEKHILRCEDYKYLGKSNVVVISTENYGSITKKQYKIGIIKKLKVLQDLPSPIKENTTNNDYTDNIQINEYIVVNNNTNPLQNTKCNILGDDIDYS